MASVATSTTLYAAPTASAAQSTPLDPTLPPVAALVPILTTTATYLGHALLALPRILYVITSFLIYPLLILAAPLLWLFSPFTLFVQLMAQLFIITPYRAFTAFADALYPVYVFLGVAIMLGGSLGVIVRFMVPPVSIWITGAGSVPEEAAVGKIEGRNSFPPAAEKPRPVVRRVSSRRRVKLEAPSSPDSTSG